ncbi:hypothetical protein ARMSODRAFT_978096 [Armillaria solidipes]|uniref:Uncharacterized protein n=1 Tax=Armillaria solidipes TaxID=1076256 RepID=A0A2H3BF12_9AGAR|nr:hypothetical protein ARMSODRAFT_978096 [Armillaria solidipes]
MSLINHPTTTAHTGGVHGGQKWPSEGDVRDSGPIKYARSEYAKHERKRSLSCQRRNKRRGRTSRRALQILSSTEFRANCIAVGMSKRAQPLYYDRSSIVVCKPPSYLGKSVQSDDLKRTKLSLEKGRRKIAVTLGLIISRYPLIVRYAVEATAK